MPPYQAPKGTQDVFAPESARWQALVARFAVIAGRAGYGLVVSPMLEDVDVFRRLGEGTDVVTKEMYELDDKGGRRLALRPEGTAPIARAYVQHRPPVPWKSWYVTPAFRYEQPQAGRLRQHHQVGLEVIGSPDPDVDVEVIALGHEFVTSLGLRRFRLAINSMGTPADRVAYAERLQRWLRERLDQLAPDDRDKVERHPVRVLDSKRPETQEVVSQAPFLVDELDPASRAHFDRVQAGLTALGIKFEVDPRLVRGFDYYTHTLFEVRAESLDAAQDTLVGGGRYDGLIEQLGGPPTPGMGFGSGIERVLLTCDAEGVFAGPDAVVDVFVVDTTGGDAARDLAAGLRAAGIATDRAFDQRSMKAQLKAADRSGARLALIVGSDEMEQGIVTLRELRGEGDQVAVARADVVAEVQRRLAS